MYIYYMILFTTIKNNAIARKCSELKSQWAQVQYTEIRKTSVWFICLFYFLIEYLISHAKIGNCMWEKKKAATVVENQEHDNAGVRL